MASGRVVGIVALCAVAAVAAVVGATLLLSRNESTTLPGAPVLQLEVGPRTPLGKAAKLLNNGHAAEAAAIFRRYPTPEAKFGLALTQWGGGSTLATLQTIADANPDDPALLLNLGWAEYEALFNTDAQSAWQETASRFPDSPYAIDALNALNPGIAPGLPPIIVDASVVPAKARAPLVAGIDLWNRKEVVSARLKLDEAARLAQNSPETLVAAAVARFSPATPLAPFPHLGPLTAKFPHDSIVRLHLGVLLLWSQQVAKGKEQLRLAVAEQPGSVYARQAILLLRALKPHN